MATKRSADPARAASASAAFEELADQDAREKARRQQQKEMQKQLERFDREHEARMRDRARGMTIRIP